MKRSIQGRYEQSSMIEGTRSSLFDLLLFELEQEPGVPLDRDCILGTLVSRPALMVNDKRAELEFGDPLRVPA